MEESAIAACTGSPSRDAEQPAGTAPPPPDPAATPAAPGVAADTDAEQPAGATTAPPDPATASAAPGVAADTDDEKLCRYCFDGEEFGELLSPCACAGGQKWVHLACLRRWQRMVLVSQPTHPAFYESDARHYKCNVRIHSNPLWPAFRSQLDPCPLSM